MVNQIELNPYCLDNDILQACQENNILVQAYAPIGSGKRGTEAGKPSGKTI